MQVEPQPRGSGLFGQEEFHGQTAERRLACTASNQIESALDQDPSFLAYTPVHASDWQPMSVAFWSVLLSPTSHRLPLPVGTGKGLAQTRVFRSRSLLLAHSPVSPCTAPIITVSPPPPRGRAAPLRPSMVGEVGASTPNPHTVRSRARNHSLMLRLPILVFNYSLSDLGIDTHLGFPFSRHPNQKTMPPGPLVVVLPDIRRIHSSGHSVQAAAAVRPRGDWPRTLLHAHALLNNLITSFVLVAVPKRHNHHGIRAGGDTSSNIDPASPPPHAWRRCLLRL